jgi:hypothetical protein
MDNSQQVYFEPAHDVISLPSGGRFYKNKKDSVKVAYMTASDENILTSPNLLQSGKVLDVLLEKKILDKENHKKIISENPDLSTKIDNIRKHPYRKEIETILLKSSAKNFP